MIKPRLSRSHRVRPTGGTFTPTYLKRNPRKQARRIAVINEFAKHELPGFNERGRRTAEDIFSTAKALINSRPHLRDVEEHRQRVNNLLGSFVSFSCFPGRPNSPNRLMSIKIVRELVRTGLFCQEHRFEHQGLMGTLTGDISEALTQNLRQNLDRWRKTQPRLVVAIALAVKKLNPVTHSSAVVSVLEEYERIRKKS